MIRTIIKSTLDNSMWYLNGWANDADGWPQVMWMATLENVDVHSRKRIVHVNDIERYYVYEETVVT